MSDNTASTATPDQSTGFPISHPIAPLVVNPGSIVPSAQSNTLIAINASQMPFKLTKDNYTAWRTQLRNLLFGYDLLGFLDGSSPCPPEFLFSSELNTMSPNSAWKLWKRQDSFIHQTIVGSITPNLSSLVTSSLTSDAAWTKLEHTYANKSRTRMLSLRDSLLKIRKDSLSVDDYMHALKRIADKLALIGHPITDDELIVYVLNGLSSDFKELSAAICARDSVISFEELHDKLLDQETVLHGDSDVKTFSPLQTARNARPIVQFLCAIPQ